MSDELRRHTIPVVDNLQEVSIEPDVIHGHHTFETIFSLLRFPRAPAIFVCHDLSAWHDTPPRLPQIQRFVAVDETRRDRLVERHDTPPDRTVMIHNAVDLNRFQPRGPLPERPRHALVLSNYACHRELAIIKAACALRGVKVDAAGKQFGNPSTSPETLLHRYDLVFAMGRCAIEALACGAAVIVCDVEAALQAAECELQRWTTLRTNGTLRRYEGQTPRLPLVPRMYRSISFRKRLTRMCIVLNRLTDRHSQRAA